MITEKQKIEMKIRYAYIEIKQTKSEFRKRDLQRYIAKLERKLK